MKLTSVKCHICGNLFDRPSNEVARNIRQKTKFICKNSACRKAWGKLSIKLRKDNHGNKELAKNASNRHDIYSPFRVFLHRAKHRQKESAKKTVTITLEDLKTQWEKQNGKCSITGIEMELYNSTHYKYNKLSLCSASLDRINSDLGYEVGNIQFVCFGINMAKNKFHQSDVCDFISKIKMVGPE